MKQLIKLNALVSLFVLFSQKTKAQCQNHELTPSLFGISTNYPTNTDATFSSASADISTFYGLPTGSLFMTITNPRIRYNTTYLKDTWNVQNGETPTFTLTGTTSSYGTFIVSHGEGLGYGKMDGLKTITGSFSLLTPLANLNSGFNYVTASSGTYTNAVTNSNASGAGLNTNGTGNPMKFISSLGTTSFSVMTTNPAAYNQYSVFLQITMPSPVITSTNTLCTNNSKTITGTCSIGAFQLYSDAVLTNPISSIVSPTSTTTYYGGCVSTPHDTITICKSPSLPIVITVSTCPNPVNILSFNAQNQTEGIALKWLVANENNVDNFLLEKSTDAINFYGIDKIIAKNNFGVYSYYVIDRTAILPQNYYYRLNVHDFDGTQYYSEIINLNKTLENNNAFKVFPNPINNEFYFTINKDEQLKTANIYDVNGNILDFKLKDLSNNFYGITFEKSLVNGIYILKVITQENIYYYKIVK